MVTPSVSVLENLSVTDYFVTDSFTYMNAFCTATGVATIENNSAIAGAAQNHATYEADNSLLTHDETAGNPGYTGASSTPAFRRSTRMHLTVKSQVQRSSCSRRLRLT
jgi:uncharacterized protein YkwD